LAAKAPVAEEGKGGTKKTLSLPSHLRPQ
jgi:hypothetical protein